MKLTPLTPDEARRYSAHTALCEIDLAGQQALRQSRVLIVGLGGLGSPVALYLAAAGVGTLGLLDADTVSLSNLQRQIIHTTTDLGRLKVDSAADKIRAINPGVAVECMPMMLTADNCAEIIGRYDLVADCTDSRCSRLLVADACSETGTTLVFGAVSRFSGMVFTVVSGSATYRDFFGSDDSDQEGDLPCSVEGVLNTVVGITGSLQATEAVKAITRTGSLLTNRLLTFNALTMEFNLLAI